MPNYQLCTDQSPFPQRCPWRGWGTEHVKGGGRHLARGHALRLSESGSCLYVDVAVASPDLLSVTCSRILSGVATTALLVKVSSLTYSHAWHLLRCPHGKWIKCSTMIMREITSLTAEHQPLPSEDTVYVTNGKSSFISSMLLVGFFFFLSSTGFLISLLIT